MSNSIYKRHNKTQNVNNINEPKTTKGKEYDRTKTKKNNTSQKKHTKLQNLELYTTHYSELNTKQTILKKKRTSTMTTQLPDSKPNLTQ